MVGREDGRKKEREREREREREGGREREREREKGSNGVTDDLYQMIKLNVPVSILCSTCDTNHLNHPKEHRV